MNGSDRRHVAPGAGMRLTKGYWIYRIIALAWMAMIFFLTSRSDLPVQSLLWGQDKIMHTIAFGILGFLFARSLRPKQGTSAFARIAVITLMVALYGAFDEIHQLFVKGREASLGDLAADTAGGLVAAVLFWKRQVFKR
jgi:VanZ family protein